LSSFAYSAAGYALFPSFDQASGEVISWFDATNTFIADINPGVQARKQPTRLNQSSMSFANICFLPFTRPFRLNI